MSAAPLRLPLFPLGGAILFPRSHLPLHIFEPRYREMVADVAQSHGLIGMVMLKGDWERDYYANPDVYEVGCAGRITTLARLPDGRYNLILDGVSEFRVVREVREKAYRTAHVQWCPAAPIDLDGATMRGLRELLIRFLGPPAHDLWRSLVEQRGLMGADLINFICFHLDVAPIEKQTLLAALGERAGCLLDILTFQVEERKLGPGGGASGSSGPLQ